MDCSSKNYDFFDFYVFTKKKKIYKNITSKTGDILDL